MFKKVLAVVLAVLLLVGALSFTVFAEEEPTVTEIRTVEDLYMVNLDLAGNYKLMNDIDLTEATAKGGDWDFGGRGWEPIGSDGIYSGNTPFTGTFDGNGHEIIGMRININSLPSGTNEAFVGLFARNNGTIKNLIVSGSIDASVSTYYVGSITGGNNGTIESCTNNASVKATTLRGYAGGIAGYNGKNSQIIRCTNNAVVNGRTNDYSNIYAGGIAGYSSGSISECYNSETVTSYCYGYISGAYYYSYSSGIAYGGTIADCYNTGDIASEVKYTSTSKKLAYSSGISASSSSSETISNCYNTGKAIKAISDSTVTNCYFLSGSGEDTTGAKSLTAAQMKLKAMYRGFDFDNTWFIDSSGEYPYPQLINNAAYPPEQPTEPVTEAPTEPVTEVPTEPVTETVEYINEVSLSVFPEYIAGDYTTDSYYCHCPEEAGYDVSSYNKSGEWKYGKRWYDNTDGVYINPDNSQFEYGHIYTVSFMLDAGFYHIFADDVTATVNGTTADVISQDRYSIIVEYTFPETDPAYWASEAPTEALCDHVPAKAVTENYVAASCDSEGSYDLTVYCSVCGDMLNREHKTIPATEHSLTYVSERPSSIGKEGCEGHYKCINCNKLFADATGAVEVTADDLIIPAANYYVVGTFTNWAVNTDYALTELSNSLYVYNNLPLDKSCSFKIVYAVGTEPTYWYPAGMGNNIGDNGEITADGIFDVYFKPNGGGGSNWYYDCININGMPDATEEAPTEPATEISTTEIVTEAPTEPATEAPTEPATEAPTEPATEAPTELVTEAPTEPATEAPTEPVTEAPTEPATEAPTEPVTEAPTQTPTQAAQAIVTVFNGNNAETKILNVGDTFTVYTTLNTGNIDGGRISTVAGEQSYTASVLSVDEELDDEQIIVDNNRVFPVMKDKAIGNCAESGKVYFSGTTPSVSSSPFLFSGDNSILTAVNYKVTGSGVAMVTTSLTTLAMSDIDITRIVDKGIVKNPDFTMKTSFEKPADVTYYLGDADGSGEVDAIDATVIQRYTTKVKVNYPEKILMQGDVDGDGDLTVVDATYIQRYSTRVKVPYAVGELITSN